MKYIKIPQDLYGFAGRFHFLLSKKDYKLADDIIQDSVTPRKRSATSDYENNPESPLALIAKIQAETKYSASERQKT